MKLAEKERRPDGITILETTEDENFPAGYVAWDEMPGYPKFKHLAPSLRKKLNALDVRLQTSQSQKERYRLYKEIIKARENGLEFCLGLNYSVLGEYECCELAVEIEKRREMVPHAERGKKVVQGAAVGGATRKNGFKINPSLIVSTLREFLPISPTLTRARCRTSKKLGISLRTVVTHTKEFQKRAPV